MTSFGLSAGYDAERPQEPWRVTLELRDGTRENEWFREKQDAERFMDALDNHYERYMAVAEWRTRREFKRMRRHGLAAWTGSGEAV